VPARRVLCALPVGDIRVRRSFGSRHDLLVCNRRSAVARGICRCTSLCRAPRRDGGPARVADPDEPRRRGPGNAARLRHARRSRLRGPWSGHLAPVPSLAGRFMSSLSRAVAIVGVGYSELSRAGEPNPRSLTLTAAKAALDDAGLSGNDLDGIFEYKFGPESPGAQDVARLLGVCDLAAFADIFATGPPGLASALVAVMAVASGACETVLVFRCLTRAAGYQGGADEGPQTVGGHEQFLTPYGSGLHVGGILVDVALKKRRWMAEYSRPEEDFGRIAVNARRWAALNPRAALRDELTMDDYLSSRMIVDPLRLLDCDYPINGAVATVITSAERAVDLRQRPVIVDAMTYATGRGAEWTFDTDFLYGGTFDCAKRLWQRSSVTLEDVDVAELYDGFTPVTVSWIEALGVC